MTDTEYGVIVAAVIAQAIDLNRRAYLESVGRRVRARRIALRLSQKRVATIIGKRQGTISKLERGALEPTFGLLWLVAGALGMSLDELGAYPAVVPPFPQGDDAREREAVA